MESINHRPIIKDHVGYRILEDIAQNGSVCWFRYDHPDKHKDAMFPVDSSKLLTVVGRKNLFIGDKVRFWITNDGCDFEPIG